jgi:hypothetical protein
VVIAAQAASAASLPFPDVLGSGVTISSSGARRSGQSWIECGLPTEGQGAVRRRAHTGEADRVVELPRAAGIGIEALVVERNAQVVEHGLITVRELQRIGVESGFELEDELPVAADAFRPPDADVRLAQAIRGQLPHRIGLGTYHHARTYGFLVRSGDLLPGGKGSCAATVEDYRRWTARLKKPRLRGSQSGAKLIVKDHTPIARPT